MASLLRSRVNGCMRRMLLSMQSSPVRLGNRNTMRCVQRRLASSESSGGEAGGSMILPLVGTVSLGIALYYVS